MYRNRPGQADRSPAMPALPRECTNDGKAVVLVLAERVGLVGGFAGAPDERRAQPKKIFAVSTLSRRVASGVRRTGKQNSGGRPHREKALTKSDPTLGKPAAAQPIRIGTGSSARSRQKRGGHARFAGFGIGGFRADDLLSDPRSISWGRIRLPGARRLDQRV